MIYLSEDAASWQDVLRRRLAANAGADPTGDAWMWTMREKLPHESSIPGAQDSGATACMSRGLTMCPISAPCAGNLETWLSELWAAAHAKLLSSVRAPTEIQPPDYSLVASFLDHLLPPAGCKGSGACSKEQVAASVLRGAGAHLAPSAREELAAEIAR